jgi:hypothetical protein
VEVEMVVYLMVKILHDLLVANFDHKNPVVNETYQDLPLFIKVHHSEKY